jgi:hypothetical protein
MIKKSLALSLGIMFFFEPQNIVFWPMLPFSSFCDPYFFLLPQAITGTFCTPLKYHVDSFCGSP